LHLGQNAGAMKNRLINLVHAIPRLLSRVPGVISGIRIQRDMFVTIAGGLIAGVVILLLGMWIDQYRISHQVSQFRRQADVLIQQEKYESVPEISKMLSEQAQKTAEVQLILAKARAFKAAFEQQDYNQTDGRALDNLRVDAEWVDKQENSVESACVLGIINTLLDRPSAAVQQFQEAESRNSRYARLYSYWGNTLERWHLPNPNSWAAEAEEKYKKAVQLADDYEWPLINLGILTTERVDRAEIPDYEKALDYFAKAKKAAPTNPNVFMNSAAVEMQMGVIYRDEKNNPTIALQYFGYASTDFQQASKLGLDSAPLHFHWGSLLDRTGDRGAAIDQYNTALERNPHYLPACASLAKLLKRSGELDKAQQTYKTCRDLQLQFVTDLSNRATKTYDQAAKDVLNAEAHKSAKDLEALDRDFRTSPKSKPLTVRSPRVARH
jgi:tetratricopeptide (TPR) repeat protein